MVSQEKQEKSFSEKVKNNPWMLATIVLGIITLVLVAFFMPKSALTGNVISDKEAGDKLLSYINTIADSPVDLVSTSDVGNLYEVKVSYQGQTMPLYITKDGKYWTSVVQTFTSAQQQAEQPANVPKTDKPVAEAFVFSYCPYGLQFEKALLPVYKILKSKADIRIVFIGAMHGQYEETESLRQVCIQKLYSKDKLFDYLEKFAGETKIGDCNGNEACSQPYVDAILAQLSIDKTKVASCMSTDGKTLYQQDQARAQQLGISGSPGFVVNGVQVSVARSPSAIKDAICSSFNTVPSECSQTVSAEQASPSFGYAASSSASAASCG
jgi:protein-disulfide isomerase